MNQLIENIDFPFCALGLLADNAFNYGATAIQFQYNSHK